MHFQQRKIAARNSVIVMASCAAAYGIGCSSRVELGIDSQYHTGVGGSSFLGTQSANPSGGSGVPNSTSLNFLGTGGTYLTGSTYSAGGTNSVGGTSNVLAAPGGTTSTGLPSTGPSGKGCLAVNNGYVTTNEFAGYAYTFATQSTATASNPVTISPSCDATGCTSAFLGNAVCSTGSVGASTDNGSSAGITFNVNQPNDNNLYNSVSPMTFGSYGLRVDYTNTAASSLRVQLKVSTQITYCFELPPVSGTSYIPWGMFNTACWDGTGTPFSPSVPIVSIQMIVSGHNVDVPFYFCLLCAQTFSGLQ